VIRLLFSNWSDDLLGENYLNSSVINVFIHCLFSKLFLFALQVFFKDNYFWDGITHALLILKVFPAAAGQAV